MAKALPEQWSASVLRPGIRIEREKSAGAAARGAGVGSELVVADVLGLALGVDMTDRPSSQDQRHHDYNTHDGDDERILGHGQRRGTTTPGGGGGNGEL